MMEEREEADLEDIDTLNPTPTKKLHIDPTPELNPEETPGAPAELMDLGEDEGENEEHQNNDEDEAEENSEEAESEGEELGSESDSPSEIALTYDDFKKMTEEKESFDQQDFYCLFYNTTLEQFKEILILGKPAGVFDLVWKKNIRHNIVQDPFYYRFGGLLFSHDSDESFEEEDAEFALKLKALFEHWPFKKSISTLLELNESDCFISWPISAELLYAYGADIFTTFIAQRMPQSLSITLDALSKSEGKNPYHLRSKIEIEKNGKTRCIRLVEVAILARSYDCLAVLLKRGFFPTKDLKFCSAEEQLGERAIFYKWFQELVALKKSLLDKKSSQLIKTISEALIIKLKSPGEKISKLLLFNIKEHRKFIRRRYVISKELLALHDLSLFVTRDLRIPCQEKLLGPKKPVANPVYTFLDSTAYQLPDVPEETRQNTLITTMLYRCIRYGGLSLKTIRTLDPKVNIILGILIKFDKDFETFELNDFKKYIEEQETQAQDFFGDDLSDDSDDERKEEYEKWDDRQKLFTGQYAQHIIFKTNLGELIEKKAPHKLKNFLAKSTRGDNKGKAAVSKEGIPRFKQIGPCSPFERQKFFGCTEITPGNLHCFPSLLNSKLNTVSEIERQKQDDLNMINFYVTKNQIDLLQKKLHSGEIKTRFIICQYRGIHYNTASWTAKMRRVHRKSDEKGQSQFSSSISVHHPEAQRLPKAKEEADRILQFKQDHKDLFCELQAFYTNYYDKFHLLLRYAISGPALTKDGWKKVLGRKQNSDELAEKFIQIQSIIRKYLSHPENPFVSTGDLPFHALRYAYGLKTYPGHQDERLRPRWNSSGQAERPYSGKFYVSAFRLEEYLAQPANHVFSMHNAGEIVALSTNKAERETSFFSYQPGKNIVYQHIAKYPSFTGEFHDLFEYKYGLNKQLYDIFKKTLKEAPPHSEENWNAKALLGELLCAYQEAVTLDFMRNYALKQGAVLIYRSRWGAFEFIPSNIHSEKEEKTKEHGGWITIFGEFIETRKKVFKNQPQKELVDAMLCGDLERIEAALKNIDSSANLTGAVSIPEYQTEPPAPAPSYNIEVVANRAKNKLISKMLKARKKELEKPAEENQIQLGF